MSNDEFQNSFENATLEIIKGLAINMEIACLLVEREAKQNCPVDEGVLRAAMFSQVSLDNTFIKGTVGNSMEYAPYVHQGTGLYAIEGDGRKTPWGYEIKSGKYKGFHWTHGQKPNPFLQKARDENKDTIIEILAGD